jgi:hypothetical protein
MNNNNRNSSQHNGVVIVKTIFGVFCSLLFLAFVVCVLFINSESDVTKVANACIPPTPVPTYCPNPYESDLLSISRNSVISINESTVALDLTHGFQELRVDSDGTGSDDISCCFHLYLLPGDPVHVITSDALRDISSTSELNQLQSYGYDINYVESISYDGGAAGLAQIGEDGFAIAVGYHGMVIYHEYGHTMGLYDLDGDDEIYRLMYSDEENPGGWYTTSSECDSLMGN